MLDLFSQSIFVIININLCSTVKMLSTGPTVFFCLIIYYQPYDRAIPINNWMLNTHNNNNTNKKKTTPFHQHFEVKSTHFLVWKESWMVVWVMACVFLLHTIIQQKAKLSGSNWLGRRSFHKLWASRSN